MWQCTWCCRVGPALITAVGEAPLSPHSVGGRGRTPSLAPLIQGPARPTQTRHRPTTAVLSYIRHSETPRHWVCQSSIPTTGCTSYYFLELVLARQGPIVIYYHTRHVDVGIGVGCNLRLCGRSTSKKHEGLWAVSMAATHHEAQPNSCCYNPRVETFRDREYPMLNGRYLLF